jgi:hypothetical protein
MLALFVVVSVNPDVELPAELRAQPASTHALRRMKSIMWHSMWHKRFSPRLAVGSASLRATAARKESE